MSTGQYKIIDNKEITLKYQKRLGDSYFHNSYWCGEEYLVYNTQQKSKLARDLGLAATAVGVGSLVPSLASVSVPLLTELCLSE